tara:strand:- start:8928 stop:9131 length:204 start_codon:yes stop_codon:yes gene_type:complete
MLEILQGTSYVLSFMFFWSGAIYFDMKVRKMKQEIEAQKKFQQVMQSKEFMKEYLDIMKSGKEDKDV